MYTRSVVARGMHWKSQHPHHHIRRAATLQQLEHSGVVPRWVAQFDGYANRLGYEGQERIQARVVALLVGVQLGE